MKTKYVALVTGVGLALLGCASKKETVVETPDQTLKRVHTQDELKKTGETQTGAALEKVDPAVQSPRHP